MRTHQPKASVGFPWVYVSLLFGLFLAVSFSVTWLLPEVTEVDPLTSVIVQTFIGMIVGGAVVFGVMWVWWCRQGA
jgi:hypothetical protein